MYYEKAWEKHAQCDSSYFKDQKNMKLMSQVHAYIHKCTRKCLRNTFPSEVTGLNRNEVRDGHVMFEFYTPESICLLLK